MASQYVISNNVSETCSRNAEVQLEKYVGPVATYYVAQHIMSAQQQLLTFLN